MTIAKIDLVKRIKRRCCEGGCNGTSTPPSETLISCIVTNLFTELIGAMKKGERVEIRHLGSFKVKKYKSRTGRNPAIPTQTFNVPARYKVAYKCSKDLIKELNEARS